PPAVKDAQVQSAIAADFHAAGSRRFQRAARVVQPYVDALHEIAGDVHVVIFEEHNAAAKFRTPSDVQNLGDQFFAAMVARVCLAGEDELHRTLFVIENGGEAIQIA